eukprot:3884690-Rhodomonas_salina.2
MCIRDRLWTLGQSERYAPASDPSWSATTSMASRAGSAGSSDVLDNTEGHSNPSRSSFARASTKRRFAGRGNYKEPSLRPTQFIEPAVADKHGLPSACQGDDPCSTPRFGNFTFSHGPFGRALRRQSCGIFGTTAGKLQRSVCPRAQRKHHWEQRSNLAQQGAGKL